MGIAGVWVQQLAADLNDSITYSNAGGTNYAEAGAVTGEGNDGINMHNQVAAYLAGTNGKPAGKASPTALYALFGGSNDITNNLTSSTLNKVAATAADNIATEINSLANAGGQNFLWLNMCSLETTPRYYGTSSQSTLASADAAFDNEWTKDLARLKTAHPNMILIGYDYHSLCVNAVVDPASYGFTDALDAWTTAPASVMYSKHSSDPDADYFVSWDGIHPTTRFNQITADDCLSALTGTFIPSPLTGLAATPGSASVTLTWNKSTAATSYTVSRAIGNGSPAVIASGIGGTSYTDTTASNGTTYLYSVIPVNANGQGQAGQVSTGG